MHICTLVLPFFTVLAAVECQFLCLRNIYIEVPNKCLCPELSAAYSWHLFCSVYQQLCVSVSLAVQEDSQWQELCQRLDCRAIISEMRFCCPKPLVMERSEQLNFQTHEGCCCQNLYIKHRKICTVLLSTYSKPRKQADWLLPLEKSSLHLLLSPVNETKQWFCEKGSAH